MNKLIFQIGFLGFCIATVVFGTQSNSLLDTVSRAFIVFVAVIVTATGILSLALMFASKNKPADQAAHPVNGQTSHPHA